MTISIEIDGADKTHLCTSWQITRNDGAVCYEGRASFKDDGSLFTACDPSTDHDELRFVITVDSVEHSFLIEERSESLNRPGLQFDIWGRSAHAFLGAGFSRSMNDTGERKPICSIGYEELCTSQALCEGAGGTWDSGAGTCSFPPEASPMYAHPWQDRDCLVSSVIASFTSYCDYDHDIDWTATNYRIFRGTFSVENQYPIDVLKKLADVCGAEIIPETDGSITVRQYSVDASGATSAASYTGTDDIVSLSSRIEPPSRCNAVLVVGYNDATDEGIEESQYGAFLSAVRLDDGAAIDAGESFRVRIYKYHPTGSTLDDWQSSDSGVSVAVVSGMDSMESITETVALKWGSGSRTYPDTTGEQRVEDSDHEDDYYATSEESYSVTYRDYTVTGLAEGTYTLAWYYEDHSAETSIQVQVGDASETSTPFLSAVETSAGPYGIGDSVSVRLYFHNPNSATILTDTLDSDTVSIVPGGTGTEIISETVNLTWGAGRTSMPDTDGVQSVFYPALVDDPMETSDETYSVRYKNYTLSSSIVGDHPVVFYYDDKSASTQVSFTVQTVDPVVYRDQTVFVKNYFNDVPIVGAAVYCSQSFPPTTYIGTTDADGKVTVNNCEVGETYYIKITKTGFQDSDDDYLENDSFVAG